MHCILGPIHVSPTQVRVSESFRHTLHTHTYTQYLDLYQHTNDGRHLAVNWEALNRMQFAGDNCWQQAKQQMQGNKSVDQLLEALDELIDSGGQLLAQEVCTCESTHVCKWVLTHTHFA